MRSCQYRTLLAQMLSADAFEKQSQKGIAYMLTLTMIMFDWLNDITNLIHNAFATSAKSHKTAFGFHFFDFLHALKSYNGA